MRRVLVEFKNHDVKRLFVKKGGGYTTKRSEARKRGMGKPAWAGAQVWAQKNGYKVRATRSRYPFIIVDNDTRMVRPHLARKINRLGKRSKRYIWMGEGWRSYQRQQELYRMYLNGTGNLAAVPGTSRHESGNAADISIFLNGPDRGYTNVGLVDSVRRRMRHLGLALTVPGEPWHCEIAGRGAWRA